MKIGVFFEFAALTSGFGMLVGGFFGMNTISGLEETRLAWGVSSKRTKTLTAARRDPRMIELFYISPCS